MILTRPSFKILRITDAPEELVEHAGRLCYKSRPKEESRNAFIRNLIKSGHESVIEHASMTVMFITDRGVTHEEVRHRLSSYSQESSRYVDYKGGCEFIIPPWISDLKEGEYPPGTPYPLPHDAGEYWYNCMMDAERYYWTLRQHGWGPEMARDCLPTSTKTQIIHTTNMRNWRHILNLRAVGTTGKPHPQMREIMVPLLGEVKKIIPVFFEDIDVEIQK